jgi:hypothetical protein
MCIQQVGYLARRTPSDIHAAVWSGTPASAVDLNPADARSSLAYATNGLIQAGYGYSSTPVLLTHAKLWKGTADSVIDLHELLPDDVVHSTAYSIDAADNIYGPAYESDGTLHAVEWLTQDAIEATGIPPIDAKESALIATLPPANYTAIVREANGTIGVALVEVYKLSPAP